MNRGPGSTRPSSLAEARHRWWRSYPGDRWPYPIMRLLWIPRAIRGVPHRAWPLWFWNALTYTYEICFDCGTRVKKPTWLYAVGVDLAAFKWGASPASGQLPHRDSSLSAAQRERMTIPTPSAFRDLLIGMARTSSVTSAVTA